MRKVLSGGIRSFLTLFLFATLVQFTWRSYVWPRRCPQFSTGRLFFLVCRLVYGYVFPTTFVDFKIVFMVFSFFWSFGCAFTDIVGIVGVSEKMICG